MQRWSLVAIFVPALAIGACGSPRATEAPHTETARTGAGDPDPARARVDPPRSDPPRSDVPRSEPPPVGRVVDGFFVAEGAPDPLACASDAECTYGQTYDASGCCGTYRDVAAAAQSTAYRAWQESYVAAHCADRACPPPPVPTAPPPCLFEVRCAEGRCDNACAW